MNTETAQPVVQVKNLRRRFRRKCAVDGVSLEVPSGCVFGLLGENGAGKTTLIKHLLGSLVAKEGEVRVLGKDPAAHPVDVLAEVGYLSEDRIMPRWMRIQEYMSFNRAFYLKWDAGFADELLNTFQLDPHAKIKTLSRGEKAKCGLLMALAHRPELLILDEPSSGLDVIVRREILGAIVRNVALEGRTVFFSSHLIDEVERVCDYIAIMAHGKLVLSDTLEGVKEKHERITIRFDAPLEKTPKIDGALQCFGTGKIWTVVCNGEADRVRSYVENNAATIVEVSTPSLEEIFVARAKHFSAEKAGVSE